MNNRLSTSARDLLLHTARIEFSFGDRDCPSCSNRSLLCKTRVILNRVTVSVYRLKMSFAHLSCMPSTNYKNPMICNPVRQQLYSQPPFSAIYRD